MNSLGIIQIRSQMLWMGKIGNLIEQNEYLVEEHESSDWRTWITQLENTKDSQFLWLKHFKKALQARKNVFVSSKNMFGKHSRQLLTNKKTWTP